MTIAMEVATKLTTPEIDGIKNLASGLEISDAKVKKRLMGLKIYDPKMKRPLTLYGSYVIKYLEEQGRWRS